MLFDQCHSHKRHSDKKVPGETHLAKERKKTSSQRRQTAPEENHSDYDGKTQLPPGWKCYLDAYSSKWIYWNSSTHELKYSLTSVQSGKKDVDLPKYWKAFFDKSQQSVYYYNEKTNETSWAHPIMHKAGSADTMLVRGAEIPKPKLSKAARRSGWNSHFDPARGKWYHSNRLTKQLTWSILPLRLSRNHQENVVRCQSDQQTDDQMWG